MTAMPVLATRPERKMAAERRSGERWSLSVFSCPSSFNLLSWADEREKKAMREAETRMELINRKSRMMHKMASRGENVAVNVWASRGIVSASKVVEFG